MKVFTTRKCDIVYLISIILLSYSGLRLFNSNSNAIITPFYLFSGIIMLVALTASWNVNVLQKYIIIFTALIVLQYMAFTDTVKVTSLLHLLFYLGTSYFILSIIPSNEKPIIKAHKIIIWSYFINVTIAYSLYISNISTEWLLYIFQRQDYEVAMRFPGFASEPSYLAFMVSISMLILIDYYKDKPAQSKEINLLFVIYLITVLISKTTYGYICIFIVLVYYCQQIIKDFAKKHKLIIILLITIPIPVFFILTELLQDNYYFTRIFGIFDVIGKSKSINSFLLAFSELDGSAFVRIGPFFEYMDRTDFWDNSVWIGHGIGSSTSYFTSWYYGEEASEHILNLGFFPAFIYDCGFIGFFTVILCVWHSIKYATYPYKILFILMLPNCNISTQLFWYVVICSFTISQKNRNNKKIKIKKRQKYIQRCSYY